MELARDPVFVALTRPQMFAGVTFNFFVLNGIVTIELFLVTHSAWALLGAVILHAVGCIACVEEPRIFDLWLTKATRAPRVRNFRHWGCNSYGA